MKTFAIAAAAAALLLPQLASAQVGVSVHVGQPSFYGRIDIGDYPQPQFIYAEPIVIERTVVRRSPIYLRVPPGHAKNWGKHCRAYNACGRPVYFVDDGWYQNTYVPAYHQRHGDDHERDDDHDGDHGKGNKHGKGHDKDHHDKD